MFTLKKSEKKKTSRGLPHSCQLDKSILNFRGKGWYCKVPKFPTPENFAVIIVKLEKRFYHRVLHPKDAHSIANSEDPDQTAPLGAV